MAKIKRESDQKYIEDELAQSQQDPAYVNGASESAEQYSSPESMSKRHNSHKGSKSITQGFKG